LPSPKFRLPQSIVQISGLYKPSCARSMTWPQCGLPGCRNRSRARRVLEPVLADNDVASHAAGEIHDHIDLVSRMRFTTSHSGGSMLKLPVSGSRTWMWTIAAPALAASMAVAAICSG